MREFGRMHPAVLTVYFAGVLVICMFVMNPVISIIALTGGLAFSGINGDIKGIINRILFYAVLLLLVTITNPLFSHNGATPLFFFNGNPVTLEAFLYGCGMGLMLAAVLEWCSSLSRVMSSEKIIFLIGGFYPKLSLVLSMALRFVPLFVRQMKSIMEAQNCIGQYAGHGFLEKVTKNLEILKAQIGLSIEQSIDTAASMSARGYGKGRRTRYVNYRFSVWDNVMLLFTCIMMACTIFEISLGSLDFYYYPRLSGLNIESGSIFAYISYGILCFSPFMLELWENIKWKYLISKI